MTAASCDAFGRRTRNSGSWNLHWTAASPSGNFLNGWWWAVNSSGASPAATASGLSELDLGGCLGGSCHVCFLFFELCDWKWLLLFVVVVVGIL